MPRRTGIFSLIIIGAGSLLSACATARLHDQTELNTVGERCGLALGELIQDEEARKLLFIVREKPNAAERGCVYDWARRNHLRLVVIEGITFPEQTE